MCIRDRDACFCVSGKATPEEQDAGLKWIEFLSRPENAQKWSDTEGAPSAIDGVQYGLSLIHISLKTEPADKQRIQNRVQQRAQKHGEHLKNGIPEAAENCREITIQKYRYIAQYIDSQIRIGPVSYTHLDVYKRQD